MADRDELKSLPCPFCGNNDGGKHADDCYFTLMQLGVARSQIKKAWNRRAPIQPVATKEDAGKVLVAQAPTGRRVIWTSADEKRLDDALAESFPVSHPSNAAKQDLQKLVPVTDAAMVARIQQVRNSVETIRNADNSLSAATVPPVVQAPIGQLALKAARKIRASISAGDQSGLTIQRIIDDVFTTASSAD